MEQFFDTGLLTILSSAVAGVVGWLTGKAKRKSDSANSVTHAVDAFVQTMNKITDYNRELVERNIALTNKNEELTQDNVRKTNRIEDLEELVKKLNGKIDSLSAQIEALRKQVAGNTDTLKKQQGIP